MRTKVCSSGSSSCLSVGTLHSITARPTLVLLGGLAHRRPSRGQVQARNKQAPPSLRASRPPFPLTGLRLRNQSSAHHRPWTTTNPSTAYPSRPHPSLVPGSGVSRPSARRSHHRLHPRPPTSRSRSSRHTGARNSIQRRPPARRVEPDVAADGRTCRIFTGAWSASAAQLDGQLGPPMAPHVQLASAQTEARMAGQRAWNLRHPVPIRASVAQRPSGAGLVRNPADHPAGRHLLTTLL